MKRFLLLTGGVLLGVTLILAVLPLLFKNQIKARLDREISRNLRANVRYGAVSLSLLRHFPNLTLSLQNLSVTGQAPFRGDTLVAARSLGLAFDVLSLVRGEKIKVHSIDLDQPVIGLKILRDGRANYAIYQPDTSRNELDTDTSKTAFRLQINEWSLDQGRFVYDNRQQPLLIRLDGVTHRGSGDFTQEIFDLVTTTQVRRATVAYDGTDYLTDKTLDADARMEINLPKSQYTFKNNVFKINELPLHFDGWVALPDTNVTMDLRFKVEEAAFKSLLSLVPGVYTKRFNELDAAGRVAFDGATRGTYNQSQFPAFNLNLVVTDGRFQYAGLPKPVENIQLVFKASNSTDQLENLVLNVPRLSATLGSNPIRGRILLKGLKSVDVDADVQAKANLEELTQLFPMDSLTLKGLFDLNLKAKGHYGNGQFPVVNASINLTDGYVRSAKFAEPLEQITFKGSLLNTTGKTADTRLTIGDLRLSLQNEPFVASGTVQNFDDYTWDIRAKGALDLARITALFPLEETRLAGRVDADLVSKGTYSDVKAKRYARLPTSGTAVLSNIRYQNPAYPPLRVTGAALRFTPARIEVSRAGGYVGSSDVQVSGHLTNYLGYVLDENQKLGGTLALVSQKFNVNEWMSNDNKDRADSTARKSVFEVPANLNVTLNTTVDEALYDRMILRKLTGTVTVNDQAVTMQKMAFRALGGAFQTSGSYDTKNLVKPKFDFAINLADVQILQAYQHLAVVRALLPLAQYVVGNVNSQFKLNGLLGPDMIPLMNSLDGRGIIKIIQAAVRDNPVLERLVQSTKLSELNALRLKNVLMTTEIDNGKVKFQPFDIHFDPYRITISGGNGFDGTVDYRLKFDVPSGKVGSAFNQTFANWTGKSLLNIDRVKFDLKMGGTFKNPQLTFDGSSTAKNLKESLTAKAKEGVDRLKTEAEARAKTARDSLNTVLNARKREAENRAKEFLLQRQKKLLDGLKPKPVPPKDSVLN